MRAARATLAVLAFVALAAAAEEEPAPERAYSEALRVASENPEHGAEQLAEFMRKNPRHPLADDAGLRVAEIYQQAGQRRDARAMLERVLDLPPGDQTERARLRLAQLLRVGNDLPRAYETARTLGFTALSAPEREQAHRMLADLAPELGKKRAQLRWLGQLRGDVRGSASVAAVDGEIDREIAALDDDALVRAASALGKRVPAARMWLRSAERALARGDREAAEAALEEARRAPLAGGDAAALAQLVQKLAGDRGAQDLLGLAASPDVGLEASRARAVIGIALPLTGELAEYGEESLQGALIAAGFFRAPGSPAPGLTLDVRDTRGSAEGAREALEAFAADPEVIGVVGPLSGDEAEAAAEIAEENELPLMTLSRREEIAVGRKHVFPLALSPRVEAELVAEYAIATLGLHRFALLYPDDGYGLSVRAAFWDAVTARDGEVVAVARYAPDTQDFSTPIRRLVGYELLPSGALAATGEREAMRKRAKRLPPPAAAELRAKADALTAPDGTPLPPYVDFEALFIPDSADTVGLIAPHLAFQNVLGVRLLGTSGWHERGLLTLAGQHVDGAIFPSGFFAGSNQPQLMAFQSAYQRAFARTPTYLAAQAYDAMQLFVRELLAGADDRDGVTKRLRAGSLQAGASGVISIDRAGRVTKRPHLVGVERGAFMSVDEAGGAPFLRARSAPPAPVAAPKSEAGR
ncbi:MAG TPA: ABC transporter substrate-binding protein [Myxococcota bacterium]|jgi:ABC-type branched-subunit amino acid transport system substrate-binding protein